MQDRDSCMALVLILLIVWLFYRVPYLVYAAMGVLLLGMIWPASMRPFTLFWFGLSRVLSKIMGTLMLGLIWSLLVVPIGLLRRALGKDSMRLKEWQKGDNSAFVDRNHKYTSSDINTPY